MCTTACWWQAWAVWLVLTWLVHLHAGLEASAQLLSSWGALHCSMVLMSALGMSYGTTAVENCPCTELVCVKVAPVHSVLGRARFIAALQSRALCAIGIALHRSRLF